MILTARSMITSPWLGVRRASTIGILISFPPNYGHCFKIFKVQYLKTPLSWNTTLYGHLIFQMNSGSAMDMIFYRFYPPLSLRIKSRLSLSLTLNLLEE